MGVLRCIRVSAPELRGHPPLDDGAAAALAPAARKNLHSDAAAVEDLDLAHGPCRTVPVAKHPPGRSG